MKNLTFLLCAVLAALFCITFPEYVEAANPYGGNKQQAETGIKDIGKNIIDFLLFLGIVFGIIKAVAGGVIWSFPGGNKEKAFEWARDGSIIASVLAVPAIVSVFYFG